jgi:hypothetical protein
MSADGQAGNDRGNEQHPRFGSQDQLAAVDDIAGGACGKGKKKER